MSVLIWIETIPHSDSVLEEFFEKVDFEKVKQTVTNA